MAANCRRSAGAGKLGRPARCQQGGRGPERHGSHPGLSVAAVLGIHMLCRQALSAGSPFPELRFAIRRTAPGLGLSRPGGAPIFCKLSHPALNVRRALITPMPWQPLNVLTSTRARPAPRWRLTCCGQTPAGCRWAADPSRRTGRERSALSLALTPHRRVGRYQFICYLYALPACPACIHACMRACLLMQSHAASCMHAAPKPRLATGCMVPSATRDWLEPGNVPRRLCCAPWRLGGLCCEQLGSQSVVQV